MILGTASMTLCIAFGILGTASMILGTASMTLCIGPVILRIAPRILCTSDDDPLHSASDPRRRVDDPLHSAADPLRSDDDPLHSDDDPLHSDDDPLRSDDDPLHSDDDPLHSDDDPLHSACLLLRSVATAERREKTAVPNCSVPRRESYRKTRRHEGERRWRKRLEFPIASSCLRVISLLGTAQAAAKPVTKARSLELSMGLYVE